MYIVLWGYCDNIFAHDLTFHNVFRLHFTMYLDYVKQRILGVEINGFGPPECRRQMFQIFIHLFVCGFLLSWIVIGLREFKLDIILFMVAALLVARSFGIWNLLCFTTFHIRISYSNRCWTMDNFLAYYEVSSFVLCTLCSYNSHPLISHNADF